MQAIDEIAKAADRIGITTEAYVGLAHAANLAGVDVESLNMSLQFMQRGMTDAATGTGEAVAAFNRLGLNAKALASLPAEQALGRIGDALGGVTNASERASLAMDLFGARGGPRLLALLSTGSAGIAQAQAEAAKLGIAFSRIDAAEVEQANDAMTRLGAVTEGVSRKLAIGLAPFVEGIAVRLTEAATSGQDLVVKIGAGVELASKYVAAFADTWSLAQAAYYRVMAAADYWVTVTMIGIDKVAQAANFLIQKLGGTGFDLSFLDNLAKGFEQTHDDLMRKAGQAWEDWSNSVSKKAVGRAFDEMRRASQAAAEATARDAAKLRGSFDGVGAAAAKQADQVKEAMEKMRKEVAQFGMTDAQKRAADFAALPGVKPPQVAEFKALSNQLDDKNRLKELTDQAKQFLDQVKTPAEKAMDVVKALESAFAQGKITAEQFDKGLTAAADQAKQGVASDAKKQTRTQDLPTLIRANSADAVRVAFQAQQSARDNAAQKSFQGQQLAKLDTLIAAVKENKVEVAMTGDD
jgi:hypothetical protein